MDFQESPGECRRLNTYVYILLVNCCKKSNIDVKIDNKFTDRISITNFLGATLQNCLLVGLGEANLCYFTLIKYIKH